MENLSVKVSHVENLRRKIGKHRCPLLIPKEAKPFVCTFVCCGACVCLNNCMCVCLSACIYVCVCVCVCMFIEVCACADVLMFECMRVRQLWEIMVTTRSCLQ